MSFTKFQAVEKFLSDESGATAIEYGLIAAGISVVIIGIVNTVGQDLIATFQKVADSLGQAGGGK
jgi:pilus assembly protein Flp/PilA